MLELEFEPYLDVYNKIQKIMKTDKDLRKIFYNKQDRLLYSAIYCLIKNDEIDIGFINMVKERIDNIYFLDQGIMEKYRNKGYGRKSIELFMKSVDFDEYLIGETKKDNFLSNLSARKISELIYETNDRNFYLFQPERKEEFIYSEDYVKFKKYINKKKI